MKNYCKNLLSIGLLIILQACGNADRNGGNAAVNRAIDSLNDTTESAQAVPTDVDMIGDGKVFVWSATTGGMMEMELAGVAIKKSNDKAVKAFASRMLRDHGIANEELKRIAEARGFQLPQTLPGEMAGHIADLNGLAERAFNVQYIQMMINDHKKNLKLFTGGSRLTDQELMEFAAKTLPVIQQHYQTAIEIGKRLNISNANNGDDVLGISPSKVEKK